MPTHHADLLLYSLLTTHDLLTTYRATSSLRAKVLLLDEATSALDAESEHVVQEAIDRLMRRRTTILVAHRLSTVRGADCICAVHKGRIVERGTHDELIARKGMYYKLVRRQLQGAPMGTSFDEALDVAAGS